MRRLPVSGVVLLALATSACTSGDPEPADARPSAPVSSAAPSQSPPDTSPEALKAANRTLRSLARKVTGRFQSRTDLPGASMQFDTEYDLSRRAQGITIVLEAESEGDPLYMRMLNLDGQVWMAKAEDASGRPSSCWMSGSYAEIAGMAGAAGLPVDPDADEDTEMVFVPPAVLAVELARSKSVQDGRITAMTDLYSVASAVSGKFALALGIPPSATDRVAVTIDTDAGRVTGLHAYLETVLTAAWRAGYEATSDALTVPGAFDGVSLDVSFTEQGEPIRIMAPPPRRTVDVSVGEEGFDAAMAACERT